MSSLHAFLKDYVRLNYSVSEIVERYVSWVSEDMYMILSRWNKEKWKNYVFAVKCAKRGNDVYRSQLNQRFKGLCSKSEDLIFFNPKDQSIAAVSEFMKASTVLNHDILISVYLVGGV